MQKRTIVDEEQSGLRLKILTERHQDLDDQVDELNARRVLLPSEQNKLKLLKFLRLQAREALDRFKSEEGLTE